MSSEIYRKIESRDYNADTPYYTQFYLIYADGTIETISRNFKLR
jgi:hypothetical protein